MQSLTVLEQYYAGEKDRPDHRTRIQRQLGLNKKYFAQNGKALKMLESYLEDKKIFVMHVKQNGNPSKTRIA